MYHNWKYSFHIGTSPLSISTVLDRLLVYHFYGGFAEAGSDVVDPFVDAGVESTHVTSEVFEVRVGAGYTGSKVGDEGSHLGLPPKVDIFNGFTYGLVAKCFS